MIVPMIVVVSESGEVQNVAASVNYIIQTVDSLGAERVETTEPPYLGDFANGSDYRFALGRWCQKLVDVFYPGAFSAFDFTILGANDDCTTYFVEVNVEVRSPESRLSSTYMVE